MSTVSRWIAPAVLAAGLGLVALSPTTAHAQNGDQLVRVIVDVADVVLRGGNPYYRDSNYGQNDRLIMDRDRYGRPVYYRQVVRDHRSAPPYGNAYGYHHNDGNSKVKCNKHGKCTTKFYDPRHDRDGRRHDDRYTRYDRDDRDRRDRRWDHD